MDNASIHRSKKTKECYKKNNMHIIFNAPYHSECNPIENVFSILRNKINRSQNKTYTQNTSKWTPLITHHIYFFLKVNIMANLYINYFFINTKYQ